MHLLPVISYPAFGLTEYLAKLVSDASLTIILRFSVGLGHLHTKL